MKNSLLRNILVHYLCVAVGVAPLLGYSHKVNARVNGMTFNAAVREVYKDMFDTSKGKYRFSMLDLFGGKGLRGGELYLDGKTATGEKIRSHNRYATGTGIRVNPVGRDLPTLDSFKQAVNSLPMMFESGYTSTPEYKQLLNSPQGRQEIKRQFNQTVSATSVTQGVNHLETRSFEFDKAGAQARTELRKDPTFRNLPMGSSERAQRIAIRQMEIFTKPLVDSFGDDAKRLIREDQKFLKDPKKRAKFNLQFGLSTFSKGSALNPRVMMAAARSRVLVTADDVFRGGKRVKIDMTPSKAEMAKVNVPKLMSSIKKGTWEGGKTSMKYHLPLLAILWGYQAAMLKADFASNPNRVVDLLHMYTRPAFHLSMVSFFMGANATGYAAATMKNQSWMALYGLAENSKLYVNKPILKRHKIAMELQKMSYSGLLGGIVISKFVQQWGEKLHSCTKLLLNDGSNETVTAARRDADRPLNEARIPTWKKSELEVQCQKNWLDFAGAIVTDHQTWVQVLSFFNAKFWMMQGTNIKALMKNGQFPVQQMQPLTKSTAAKTSPKARWIIRARGFAAPVVAAAGPVVVNLVVFLGIVLVTEFLLTKSWEYITVDLPAHRYKRNFATLMQDWKNNNTWDPVGLCKGPGFFFGSLRGGLNYLWNIMSFNWDANKECDDTLLKTFMSLHHQAEKTKRDGILSPVTSTIQAWVKHTSQALNMYTASKAFYKDIYTQIKLKRQQDAALSFPTLSSEDPKVLREGDPIKSSHRYDETLPLFRSHPFYGLNYHLMDSGVPMEKPLSYHTDIDWKKRVSESHGKELLQKRMQSFQSNVFPKIVETLEQLAGREDLRKVLITQTQNQGQLLDQFIAFAKSSGDDLERMTLVLERIRQYQAIEGKKYLCRVTPESMKQPDPRCPFTYTLANFIDPEVWHFIPEQGVFRFRGKSSNHYMGAKKNEDDSPFGVMPLAMGQEYLIGYETRFQILGVDPYFFNSKGHGQGSLTMTDYLLKSMICGPEVDRMNRGLLHNKTSYDWGMAIPEFSAPKLPLKIKGVEFCRYSKFRNRDNGEWSNAGWKDTAGFYHYIEGQKGPEQGRYAGIVDLLYREMDIDSMGDFDTWWEDNVLGQFEDILNSQYEIYLNKVVNGKMAKVLFKDMESFNNETVKDGYFANMKDQIYMYFEHILDPMVNDPRIELDMRFVENSKNLAAGHLQLQQEYTHLKNEFLELFDYMIGERRDLQSESLIEELNEIYENIYAENADNFEGIDFHEGKDSELRVKSIQILMMYKLSDIRRITKTDGQASVTQFFTLLRDMVREDQTIDDEERARREEAVLEEQRQVLSAWSQGLDRNGHVLMDHPKVMDSETGEEVRPRLEVLYDSISFLEVMTEEFASIVAIRDQFKSMHHVNQQDL